MQIQIGLFNVDAFLPEFSIGKYVPVRIFYNDEGSVQNISVLTKEQISVYADEIRFLSQYLSNPDEDIIYDYNKVSFPPHEGYRARYRITAGSIMPEDKGTTIIKEPEQAKEILRSGAEYIVVTGEDQVRFITPDICKGKIIIHIRAFQVARIEIRNNE